MCLNVKAKNGSSSSLALSSKACANDEDADKYEIEFDLAPIETFMEVPLRARKEHLLKVRNKKKLNSI